MRVISALVFLVLLAPAGAQVGRAPAPIGESLRVAFGGAPGLLARLQALGIHHGHVIPTTQPGWETVQVILERREFQALRRKLPPKTLARIVEVSRPFREIAAARRALQPDPNYHTRAEVVADLRKFEQDYPALCKVYDLQSRYGAALSHDGFRIYALRISTNPSVDLDQPNIAVTANTHANELATIEVPLYTARQLLSGYGSDPVLTKVVDENQIWILPNLNPDGLEYSWNSNNLWRKNRRDHGNGDIGVDMNRNYPFYWSRCGSSGSTGSSTYHGPGPGSEPEVDAMLRFARGEGLERLLDFHCTGPDVRYPFNTLVERRIPSLVRTGMDPIQQRIATAMNYAVRGTCCCGTLMEWHHAANGTMAFLVEFAACTGPFSTTRTALTNAWPGVLEFLTTPVPLTGHLRSGNGGGPLAGTLTVAGQEYQDGQEVRSGGRFGRYQLWGGAGTFDVTFAAPDHQSVTRTVTLVPGQTVVLDVVLPYRPSARHDLYGVGCPGTGAPPVSCLGRNAAGGTLLGHQSANEYAYTATSGAEAIEVRGFRLWTRAVGSAPVTLDAHLYFAAPSGLPEAAPVASGSMIAGTGAAFYEVLFPVPVVVPPAARFFVAAETDGTLTSTLTAGDPGTGYWRRPPGSGTWALSSIVSAPSYQVVCRPVVPRGVVPVLTAARPPRLGQTFTLELTRAAAQSPATLVIGASRTTSRGIPLPLDLGALGAPGCFLLASLQVLEATRTDAMGRAMLAYPIPNQAALLGAAFYEQFVVADPGVNSLGLVLTAAGAGVVGF